MIVYTLRDGTKKYIKIKLNQTLQDEKKAKNITQHDINQRQLKEIMQK